MSFNGARHELELRADVARDRLLDAIDAIDRRRHDVMDWKLQLRHHVGQVALLSAALLGGIAIVAGAGVYRTKRNVSHQHRERVRALQRFWEHPERIAVRRRRPLRAMLLMAFVAIATLAAAKIVSARR